MKNKKLGKRAGTWIHHATVRTFNKSGGEVHYVVQKRTEDNATRYLRDWPSGKQSVHYKPWW